MPGTNSQTPRRVNARASGVVATGLAGRSKCSDKSLKNVDYFDAWKWQFGWQCLSESGIKNRKSVRQIRFKAIHWLTTTFQPR
jgi:hypothetical protein